MTALRLFFALWPDDATRRHLAKASRPALKRCGGRPVPARNLHLTLAFLGDVPADWVPAIRAAAGEVAPPILDLELDRVGQFPAARVAWLGPARVPAELARVAAELWAAVAPVGVAPDRRPFRPHVTIARKIQRPPDLNAAQPVHWRVRGFALIRSVTAQEGARYMVDQEFPQGSSNEP